MRQVLRQFVANPNPNDLRLNAPGLIEAGRPISNIGGFLEQFVSHLSRANSCESELTSKFFTEYWLVDQFTSASSILTITLPQCAGRLSHWPWRCQFCEVSFALHLDHWGTPAQFRALRRLPIEPHWPTATRRLGNVETPSHPGCLLPIV
jgi:hypothetical protein